MPTEYTIFNAIYSCAFAIASIYIAVPLIRKAKKQTQVRERMTTLLWAALLFSGVGFGAMHFVGLMSLSGSDIAIAYDLLTSLTFLAIAISITYAVFLSTDISESGIANMLLPGFIMGTGLMLINFAGLQGLKIQGVIEWNYALIAIAYTVSVGSCVAFLWLANNIHQPKQTATATALIGIAVWSYHGITISAATLQADYALPAVRATLFNSLAGPGFVGTLAGALLVGAALVKAYKASRQLAAEPDAEYVKSYGAQPA